MRINAIRTNGADITIDTSELICLANVLYFYEKHWDANSGFPAPNQVFHTVAKQLVTARDIAQYGHLDKLVQHPLAKCCNISYELF